jgi:hypothetical protein
MSRHAAGASSVPPHLHEKLSEPPGTRTWNLEIKSLCQNVLLRLAP